MTLDRLAEMVQEGFLDMGERFDRLESDVGQLKSDMVEVKGELPKFATTIEHSQLSRRVVAIEDHLGL